MLKNRIRIIVAILVFLYVALGTLFILSIYSSDYFSSIFLNCEHRGFIGVFTLPINILSFGIRFADSTLICPIYIIQFITLIGCLYLADYVVRKTFQFFEKD